jgi:hypothetical protein
MNKEDIKKLDNQALLLLYTEKVGEQFSPKSLMSELDFEALNELKELGQELIERM